MKIALSVIATGKYIDFTKKLCESVRHNFLTNHPLEIFIFTNHTEVPDNTIRVHQEHHPFPYPTLMRYHIILESESLFKDFDYVFYSDADMLFTDKVGEEVLGNLVATRHPGFYKKGRNQFTYETRAESTAYVGPHEGQYYFAGGFNGGKNYLQMAKEIKENIDLDSSKGITAVWHDESHLNRYLINHPPDVILDPAYCFPQGLAHNWGLQDIKPKIMALLKDHSYFRN